MERKEEKKKKVKQTWKMKGKDKKRKKNALLSSNTYIAIFSRNSSVVKKIYICLRGGANI